MSNRDYSKLFESFSRLQILVIGDVMIDAYLFGSVNRISPEAPVPVVAVKNRTSRLGGAANVALNIAAMSVNPILCSVIGEDSRGNEFMELMQTRGLSTECMVQSSKRITTTKFRVIGNNTQMIRVDEEHTDALNSDEEKQIIDRIGTTIHGQKIDAIVIQDYDKGVITPKIIQTITNLAGEHNIPVAVDPKNRNFRHFKNITLFKPNLKEMCEGLNLDIDPLSDDSLNMAARKLHDEFNISMVFITLSEHGVFLSKKDDDGAVNSFRIPAHIRSIADVSGAGDTVVSLASIGLAAGIDPYQIALISNLAGGLVCEDVGVVPIDPSKLLSELHRLG